MYTFQGTPSLTEPSTISSILETVSGICHLPSDAEVTLEANPTSVETHSLRQVPVTIKQTGDTFNDTCLSRGGRGAAFFSNSRKLL